MGGEKKEKRGRFFPLIASVTLSFSQENPILASFSHIEKLAGSELRNLFLFHFVLPFFFFVAQTGARNLIKKVYSTQLLSQMSVYFLLRERMGKKVMTISLNPPTKLDGAFSS
jgi:hypothetical protein